MFLPDDKVMRAGAIIINITILVVADDKITEAVK